MAYKPKILTSAEGGTGSSNTATSGKVLIGNGTNFVSSTPTFPNASATSGKIIKSDGTNWVASTETYAAPSTSGNVMTSDGTNWTSAAPAAGGGSVLWFMTFAGSPTDGTTYFFELAQPFTNHTASNLVGQMIYMPRSGTITAFYGNFLVQGTLGSNENCTLAIRLNNTTDTNISTTIQLTAALVSVSNSSLNISVAAGDYIEYKFISPSWSTNPTTVSLQGSINIT